MSTLSPSIRNIASLIIWCGLGLVLALVCSRYIFRTDQNVTYGDNSEYFQKYDSKIIVYGTAWCEYCKKTRDYLQERNIKFTDLDIEESKAAAAEHAKLGGGGVPLVLIANHRIHGYSNSEFDAALAGDAPSKSARRTQNVVPGT